MNQSESVKIKSILINTAAFIIIIAGISSAKGIIIPLLLASFLAIICTPLLFWMRSKGVPSSLAILILIFLLIGLEITLAAFIGTSMAEFTHRLPQYQNQLKEMTSGIITFIQSKGINISGSLLYENINLGKVMAMAGKTLTQATGVLTNTFMVMLTLVFILFEEAGLPNKVKAMMGNREISTLGKFKEISKGVNKYLAVKIATSLVTGVIITIFLLIMKVDFAFMWGTVAFILNFIPTIGSIIAAIPAVLLTLVQYGPSSAIIVITGYLTVNTLIGNLIEPKIMGGKVGLSTLVIFLSMTFWGWVLGPIGMLLSVPLTMTLKIALSSNESTQWISILLGTDKDADEAIKAKNS